MEEKIKQLENRIIELENQVKNFSDFSRITYEVERALIARGFANANDFVSVKEALLAGGGLASETFYVAPSSGAPATSLRVVTNGIITA